MKKIKVYPVILSGGSGTRLWPWSRKNYPKQYLNIIGENTLSKTLSRISSIKGDFFLMQNPIVVTNEDQRFLALDNSITYIKNTKIILEPTGKNTAPSLYLASLYAKDMNKTDEDSVLIVLSADHWIKNESYFNKSIINSIKLALLDKVVIMGVLPVNPNTGYGYIEMAEKKREGRINYNKVLAFHEKPSIKKAKKYLEEGNYLWNAGIFSLKNEIWLNLFNKFEKSNAELINNSWKKKIFDNHFARPNKNDFDKVKPNSIDYAVIEKIQNCKYELAVLSLKCGWSDLGTWGAIKEINHLDKHNNYIKGEVVSIDNVNSHIMSLDKKMIGAMGLKDIVVISTNDAILVANNSKLDDLKILLKGIGKKNKSLLNDHRKVFRPWGWYDELDSGDKFKTKRIHVKPKSSLSLQSHMFRSEHWVVVAGQARVHYGERWNDLNVNESTYHGKEVVHALENPGDIPLELIEVQVGDYLGEDDIVRFEDKYGRVDS